MPPHIEQAPPHPERQEAKERSARMHDCEGVPWRLGAVTKDGSVTIYVHAPNLSGALQNVNQEWRRERDPSPAGDDP